MANKPLAYVLSERKANFGKLAGKTVIQARPTGRKRVDHRSFCDEVGRATTFTGAEVEAVLRLAAEIAKRHVENGDIVEFGDIGTEEGYEGCENSLPKAKRLFRGVRLFHELRKIAVVASIDS